MAFTNPLQAAIDRAGSQQALAEAIGRTQGTISAALKRGYISVEDAPSVERATGVRCEALRPDLAWLRVPDRSWPSGRPAWDLTRNPMAPAKRAR